MFSIFARNPRRIVGSDVQYSALKFSGGEIQVRITKWDTNHDHVYITAHLTDSDKIMELANLVDAFRRIDPTVKLHLICPYLPYARQDRVCADGESLALRVMTDIINGLNFEDVEVWDVHSDVSLALLNRVHNLGPEVFLEKLFMEDLNYVLVSPDAGAMKKVSKVAKKYNLPMITATKIRNPENGEITGTDIILPENTFFKTYLIVDDICDGGRTFTGLSTAINGKHNLGAGVPAKIELYVTHGIFSKTLDVLTEASISRIYTANPFPEVNLENPYLTVLEKR
jgi:ribose-phosphate pyrophosphokinase